MVLEIDVVEVRGKYPVHRVEDRIVIDGARIDLDKSDALSLIMFITLRSTLG
jgi:hypothetical protein